MRTAALLLTLLLTGWLAWPASLGGFSTIVVVSGQSMQPTYHTYDLVIARKDVTPHVGDVIVYRVPQGDPGAGRQVIHRVIGGDPVNGYQTQGDNREGPDIWHPREPDVLGTVVTLVPQGGRVLTTVLNPANLGLVLAAALVWAVWPRRSEQGPASALAGAQPRPTGEGG